MITISGLFWYISLDFFLYLLCFLLISLFPLGFVGLMECFLLYLFYGFTIYSSYFHYLVVAILKILLNFEKFCFSTNIWNYIYSISTHSQTNQGTQHAFSFTCPCFILSWNKYLLIANNLCMMLQVYFPTSIAMTNLLTNVAWILHICVFWSIFSFF